MRPSPSAKPDSAQDPIVIDTDPGIDDVVTLALAARSAGLAIRAVTTTYGNTRLECATRNARTILELADRSDVPVFAGSARPLARPLVTAPETHGESGVGYAPVADPTPDDGVPNEHVLLDVLRSVPEPLTLITLGPLTNLAHALDRDANLVLARVHRHIGMFGNIAERGNTNRWADFNAWCDPEATDQVLRAGLDTYMVGLDVTRQMVLTTAEVERLASSSDRLVGWLGQALRFYVEFHRQQEHVDGCVVNDVLTVGELLSPGLLTPKELRLTASLDDGEHRGHTLVSQDGVPVTVAMDIDTGRMRALLDPLFGSEWRTSEKRRHT